MFKKILLMLVASALLLAAAGCQCGTATTPSPSPSASASMPPATMSASPEVSPETSASPGVGDTPAATIPDFKEGTEVDEDEVPEVVSAVKEKYADAKIVSIKHAMQEDLQVYAVELTTGGKTETVYVQPDGKLLEEGAGGTGGTGGTGSGTGAAG